MKMVCCRVLHLVEKANGPLRGTAAMSKTQVQARGSLSERMVRARGKLRGPASPTCRNEDGVLLHGGACTWSRKPTGHGRGPA